MSNTSLLPDHEFSRPIERLRAYDRVGIAYPSGNTGDLLIRAGLRQLMRRSRIEHWEVPYGGTARHELDAIAICGGGNMGRLWPGHYEARQALLAQGVPVGVLPQSFPGPCDEPFTWAFARERESARITGFELAPDLALAYVPERPFPEPTKSVGRFMRADKEGLTQGRRDPAALCRTADQYLALAADWEHVHTDRLHFAVAALIAGRKATLYPNSYHKNRSVYETWLADLGCEWREHA